MGDDIRKNEDLGVFIKSFESQLTSQKVDTSIPIIVRLDGKGFSKYTKSLNKPFDLRFSRCMQETTKFLLKNINAKLAYTQSDEITLVFFNNDLLNIEPAESKGGFNFDGKIQKLVSVLASQATAKFNQLVALNIPEKKDNLAYFDCRIFNVPDLVTAAKVLLWRERDAIKNSITQKASQYYTHKELMNKSSSKKIEMIKVKNDDYNSLPEYIKRGVYFKKTKILELIDNLKIPKNFLNEGGTAIRTHITECDFPYLNSDLDLGDILFSNKNNFSIKNKP